MVRFGRRLAALFVLLGCLAAGVQAEEAVRMEVYAAEAAMDVQTAEDLVRLLGDAFPQAAWTLMDAQGGSLRQRVMDDRAPDLAICAPGEAMPWAKEGLLLPLDGRISGASRIQRAALEPGVWEERLYMAPLLARHRQMAVNADRIEQMQMDYLLDSAAYTAWLPPQLEHVLKETSMAEEMGMEVWPPDGDEGEAVMALVQALYGGAWLGDEGEVCVGTPAAILGAGWLGEMVECGAVGYVESRQAALKNFLAGETAVFIDWTEADERRWQRLGTDAPFTLKTMPYPSADGVPVRSFDLAGVCAFDTGDTERNALLMRAVSFLHENGEMQALLGDRVIWQDDAVWLRIPDAEACGATRMRLAGGALAAVLAGEANARTVFAGVQAAMDAAGY